MKASATYRSLGDRTDYPVGDVAGIEWFEKDFRREILYRILSFLSLGIVPIVSYFRPLLYLRLSSRKTRSSEKANLAYVTFSRNSSVLRTTVDVFHYYESNGVLHMAVIEVDGKRYCASSAAEYYVYRVPEVPLSFVGRFIARSRNTDEFRGSKSVASRDLLQAEYGLNAMKLPEESYTEVLLRTASSPFYLFQYFAVTLWIFEDYIVYSLLLLAISLAAIYATTNEIMYNLQRLRKLAGHDVPIYFLDCIPGLQQTFATTAETQGTSIQGIENASAADNCNYYHGTTSENLADSSGNSFYSYLSSYLVPGDRFLVQSNMTLPCDAVLISGRVVVDESMLTGESVPVSKAPLDVSILSNQSDHSAIDDAQLITTGSILYGGTKVISCHGINNDCIAVCYRTGFRSTKGQLVASLLHPKEGFLSFISDAFTVILLMLFLTTFIYLFVAYQLKRMGESDWSIFVRYLDALTVAVPPALGACLTVATAISVDRLKSKNIFVSDTSRVNFAGAVGAVCFDKTGTLTESKMVFQGALISSAEDDRRKVWGSSSSSSGGGLFVFGTGSGTSSNSGSGYAETFEPPKGLSEGLPEAGEKRHRRRKDHRRYHDKSSSSRNEALHNTTLYNAGGNDPRDPAMKLLLPRICVELMATCHNLSPIEDTDDGTIRLVGDPLEMELFRASGFSLGSMPEEEVSSTSGSSSSRSSSGKGKYVTVCVSPSFLNPMIANSSSSGSSSSGSSSITNISPSKAAQNPPPPPSDSDPSSQYANYTILKHFEFTPEKLRSASLFRRPPGPRVSVKATAHTSPHKYESSSPSHREETLFDTTDTEEVQGQGQRRINNDAVAAAASNEVVEAEEEKEDRAPATATLTATTTTGIIPTRPVNEEVDSNASTLGTSITRRSESIDYLASIGSDSIGFLSNLSSIGVESVGYLAKISADSVDFLARTTTTSLGSSTGEFTGNSSSGGGGGGGEVVYVVKGSPETVVAMCNPTTVPSALFDTLRDLARSGQRVLAMAYRICPEPLSDIMTMSQAAIEQRSGDIRFLGLLCLTSELKASTRGTISTLQEASMLVKMITGDHVHTAISVAQECGILLVQKKENNKISAVFDPLAALAPPAAVSKRNMMGIEAEEEEEENKEQEVEEEEVESDDDDIFKVPAHRDGELLLSADITDTATTAITVNPNNSRDRGGYGSSSFLGDLFTIKTGRSTIVPQKPLTGTGNSSTASSSPFQRSVNLQQTYVYIIDVSELSDRRVQIVDAATDEVVRIPLEDLLGQVANCSSSSSYSSSPEGQTRYPLTRDDGRFLELAVTGRGIACVRRNYPRNILRALVRYASVFARTKPSDKKFIVEELMMTPEYQEYSASNNSNLRAGSWFVQQKHTSATTANTGDDDIGSSRDVLESMKKKNSSYYDEEAGQYKIITAEEEDEETVQPLLTTSADKKGGIGVRIGGGGDSRREEEDEVEEVCSAEKCYHVLFCGDGANDMTALRAATVGVSLCDTETSIAAPITSKLQSPGAVIDVLIEGRSSLVTAYVLVMFNVMYGVIQLFMCCLLYSMGLSIGDYMYLMQDLFYTLVLGLAISVTPCSYRLSEQRPPKRFVNTFVGFKLISQLCCFIIFQIIALKLLQMQSFYAPYDYGDDPLENSYSYESSTIGAISLAQLMIASVVSTIGEPFRKNWYQNTHHVSALAVQGLWLLFQIFSPYNYVTGVLLQLEPLPTQFGVKLCVLIAVHWAVSLGFSSAAEVLLIHRNYDRRGSAGKHLNRPATSAPVPASIKASAKTHDYDLSSSNSSATFRRATSGGYGTMGR